MSNEEYMRRHDLEMYLVEALKHVSRTAGVVAPNRHIEAAAEYFQAVATARHVVGRDFAFVQSTGRNRMAFLVSVERACGAMPPLSSRDWHAMLQLVCPDVPAAVTEGAFLAATAARAVSNSRAARSGGRGGSGGEGSGGSGTSGGEAAGRSAGDDGDDDEDRGGGGGGSGGGSGGAMTPTTTVTTRPPAALGR